MADITVQELKERMDAGEKLTIIDVREEWEWDMDHITDNHVPMGDVPGKLAEWEDQKEAEIIVHCRSGGRSGNIAAYMTQNGFRNVRNLAGGMLAWKSNIDPSFNVQ